MCQIAIILISKGQIYQQIYHVLTPPSFLILEIQPPCGAEAQATRREHV